jgi:hypothetical protein
MGYYSYDYFTKWVEVIPTGFVLEELGATLLLKPLPFGNKKSVGGIMECGTCSWCSYLL